MLLSTLASYLQRLIRTINNRGFPPPEQPAAGGAGTSQQATLGPLQAHAATLSVPTMANTPGSEYAAPALVHCSYNVYMHVQCCVVGLYI